MTPEEKARQRIDAMLTASGWVVQTEDQLNLSASRGVAVCELSFADQTRIVAEVERRLSVVHELEAMASANLQRASCLRQSILQKAFTGNLTA